MSDYHKKAIDVLESLREPDYRKVLVEIAKHRPAVFVSASRCVNPWVKDCAELVNCGEKIQAIKLWRTNTGSSLKEAKEAVEDLQTTGARQ